MGTARPVEAPWGIRRGQGSLSRQCAASSRPVSIGSAPHILWIKTPRSQPGAQGSPGPALSFLGLVFCPHECPSASASGACLLPLHTPFPPAGELLVSHQDSAVTDPRVLQPQGVALSVPSGTPSLRYLQGPYSQPSPVCPSAPSMSGAPPGPPLLALSPPALAVSFCIALLT